jgi:Ca2+/Na+ antiporter
MLKKIIGSFLTLAGFIICGWGLYIFCMSIYYLATKNQAMGPGAGIGFFYGIALIVIGLVFLVAGIATLLSKMNLTRNQNFIILVVLIFIIIFMGLDAKILVLKEDAKTCLTYSAATFYGKPIGGEVATYEKQLPNDKYTPRRLISKSHEGIDLRFVGRYKVLFVTVALIFGIALFLVYRKK